MLVFDSLRRGLGAWAARGWVSHVVALLVYNRLGRAQQKMQRLMALFQAGRLWRRVPRAVAVAAERVDKVDPPVPRALPVDFGWLVKQAKWEAALLGSQLQTVLERPEMVALLLACPQARRVMGPICRMLAIPAHVVWPRPEGFVPEVVAAVAPKVKRVRKPRPPIDWGRIPLPRGVLTAARRAGFKPVR